MDLKKVALFFVFADFTAYTIWVAANGGGFGEVLGLFAVNPWIGQVTIDLVIALSFVAVWMHRDATSNGRNPWPWIAATCCLGSIGPLAYFAFRPSGERDPILDVDHNTVSSRA